MADVFQLTKAIIAVAFSPYGRGEIFTLPVGARLCLNDSSSLPGFVGVTHNGKLYCIFRVDLIEKSVAIRTVGAAA